MNDFLSPDFLSPDALGPEFLCPDNSSLWPAVMGDSRVPAISQHVAGCQSCQRRVAALQGDVRAIQGVPWNATPKQSQPLLREALPEKIGEYTILSQIGSGGQADVYRAWHPRLKTDVVIKWFRRDAFPEAASRQLASEVRSLMTIRHPYLAQVFDVGIDQDRHFILMEYVSGQTFSDWIRRFQPTIPRIAAVLAMAARAVDAVHKQGALHLDLKPSNILVDADGNPRVIDFGMARLSGSSSQRSLLLAPGTPEYMSPEQCVGDASRISVASDVYGLGAVLFSALSQRPIRSADQLALEPDWSLIRHASWGLRRICHRALATCPRERYESAADFATELERFAQKQSILRRCASVATVLVGIASCYGGASSAAPAPALATLEIHSHFEYEREEHTVFETQCSAVLAEQRQPCLMIVTAYTDPVRASELVETADADWRIAQLADGETAIQIAEDAGPHLILACANREWDQAPAGHLEEMLQDLQSLSGDYSIEILIDERKASLRPIHSREMTPQESEHRRAALATVEELQASLDQFLPSYSGLVVIPPRGELLASIR